MAAADADDTNPLAFPLTSAADVSLAAPWKIHVEDYEALYKPVFMALCVCIQGMAARRGPDGRWERGGRVMEMKG